MEKENGVPLPRRRPAGSDGPAPTALATQGESASDDPAGGDTGAGRDEEELAGGRPGAKRGGIAPAEAVPGPREPQGRPVASSALPQRVRGMSDGPRPPAQVARPVLPPSFLERVRAAAEAEQRLEQRAQEEARQPAEPEPPAARPPEPRRPPRFVRSRDWMARGGDKKERARGDQAGPGPQRGTAGDQLRPAREGPAGGGNGAAEPGPTVVLPRRAVGDSPRPAPAAQARPDTAVPPAPVPADASTEPIPVIRVSPAGEPLPPADATPATDAAQAPSRRPAQAATDQAATDQAPAAQGRPAPPLSGQPRTEQAPAGRARSDQAPAGPAPARHAGAAKRAAAGHSRAAKKAAGQPEPQWPARREAAAQAAPGRPGTAQQDAAQETAEQATDREAAGRQAQQAATRRAADEAAVQRAAKLLARKSSPGRNRRLVGLAAALLLVIGGVTAGLAFTGHRPHHDHLTGSDSVATVAVNRDHAAAWIARQVSPGAMVSCDPVTCVLIESDGFPASHVQALGTGQVTPLSSTLVVATPSVRHQFGPRLASVLAPGLLATFGSGGEQVGIRVVAPNGAAAYRAALHADLQNRRLSGAGLSGSNRIQAPSAARKQLVAGQVDSRLVIALALMASLHPVDLVAFGDGGPDLAAAPFRSAELSLTGSAQKRVVLGFLSHQRPPYAPARVTTRQAGPDRTILDMQFAAPSPVGLFH